MSKPFKKKSGIEKVQQYLESGRSITALEALSNFGLFRLASAIEVLRKRGLNIVTDTKQDPNGKAYARYTLVRAVNEAPAVVAEVTPKRELKVGDTVKLAEAMLNVAGWGSYKNLKGVVQEIRSAATPWPFVVKFGGKPRCDYLKASELVLVEPVKELKVGARVRVADIFEGVSRGKLGTIERIDGLLFPYEVRLDEHPHSYLRVYNANELEAI